MISIEESINIAIKAMENSYAPYSGFNVGACLVGKDDKIFTGCNIENASFGATNCAERTAFFNAINQGVKEFEFITIVGGKNKEIKEFCPPCGICRQVMNEFCSQDFKIILALNEKDYKEFTLKELLPFSFNLD